MLRDEVDQTRASWPPRQIGSADAFPATGAPFVATARAPLPHSPTRSSATKSSCLRRPVRRATRIGTRRSSCSTGRARHSAEAAAARAALAEAEGDVGTLDDLLSRYEATTPRSWRSTTTSATRAARKAPSSTSCATTSSGHRRPCRDNDDVLAVIVGEAAAPAIAGHLVAIEQARDVGPRGARTGDACHPAADRRRRSSASPPTSYRVAGRSTKRTTCPAAGSAGNTVVLVATGAAVFAILPLRWVEPRDQLILAVYCAALLVLLATDLDQKLLPDLITLPLIVFSGAVLLLGWSPVLAGKELGLVSGIAAGVGAAAPVVRQRPHPARRARRRRPQARCQHRLHVGRRRAGVRPARRQHRLLGRPASR